MKKVIVLLGLLAIMGGVIGGIIWTSVGNHITEPPATCNSADCSPPMVVIDNVHFDSYSYTDGTLTIALHEEGLPSVTIVRYYLREASTGIQKEGEINVLLNPSGTLSIQAPNLSAGQYTLTVVTAKNFQFTLTVVI